MRIDVFFDIYSITLHFLCLILVRVKVNRKKNTQTPKKKGEKKGCNNFSFIFHFDFVCCVGFTGEWKCKRVWVRVNGGNMRKSPPKQKHKNKSLNGQVFQKKKEILSCVCVNLTDKWRHNLKNETVKMKITRNKTRIL